ncbi:MAG: response regulator [Chloroflexi bacterium]|nr:response regulator [Chloroflexota bacterium]
MEKQPKILIVDDEPFNVDYLEQELEDLHYDTVSATNGQEALAKVMTESPDVILLDIMMPIMDGFEVLSHLKSDPYTRDIPVIVISAANDLTRVVKGIEMGAEDFLPKPFDHVLLRARISASLEKKQWHDREKSYIQQIEAEKARADELLRVILPEAIIDELKATNRVRPRLYNNVAVIFADVVSFTPYCDSHSLKEIVHNLQQMIAVYETAALEFDLQKIKTDGDSFMAVAGLFSKLDNPVLNCIQCGWQIIDLAGRLPDPWQIRVGIHVGPVLGAILGHRQYLFDVWGDTVNTAQRIESYGAANAVNLSRNAWLSVADQVLGESSGMIEVKGKGRLEIYRARTLIV